MKVLETHRAAVRVMKYNAAKQVVISADDKGVIEYWSPSTYEFPQDAVSFRFKLDTDLYALAKAKTKALTLEVSPDGEQFTTTGPDRKVRVFRFGSGKLRYVIDESLESANDAQRSGNATYALEDIDFGAASPWTARWASRCRTPRLGIRTPSSTRVGTSSCTPRCSGSR